MPRRNKKRPPKKFPPVTGSQAQPSISGITLPLRSYSTTTASHRSATLMSSVIIVPPRRTTGSCTTTTASRPGVTPASSRMSSVIVVPPSTTTTSCCTTTITDSRTNSNSQHGTTTPSSTVAMSSVIIVPPSRTTTDTDSRTNSDSQLGATAPSRTVSMSSVITVPPRKSTSSGSTTNTDSSTNSDSQQGATRPSSTVSVKSVIIVPPGTPIGAFSASSMPQCTIPIHRLANPSRVIGSITVYKEQTSPSSSTHLPAAGISPQVAVPVTSANTRFLLCRSKRAVTSPIHPVSQTQMMPSRRLLGQQSAHSHSHSPTAESPTGSKKPRNLGPDSEGLGAEDYDQMSIATVPNPARESDSSSTTDLN